MKNVVKQKKFCEILLPLPFVKASDEGKTVLDLTINPHILMAAGDLKQLRFLFDYCERFFNGLSMAVCVTKISKYDGIQEEYGFNLTTRGTYDLRNPLKVKDFYESMSDRLEEMKKFNVRDFCDLKFKRKSLQNYLSPQDKRSPANLEEFEKFISCVDKEIYKQLFIVLYYTGLRIGEALALQWSDFENNELHITKAITRKTESGKYELKETKNISSIRDVDVGKVLGDYLRTFKAHEMKHIGFREDWFIFGRTQHLPQTSIDRVKDTAIKKAGVKRIRLHDFRHSHASNLIANGINIVAVSRRLGHSDINITLSVYTHLLKKNELELTHFIDNSSQHLLNA